MTIDLKKINSQSSFLILIFYIILFLTSRLNIANKIVSLFIMLLGITTVIFAIYSVTVFYINKSSLVFHLL